MNVKKTSLGLRRRSLRCMNGYNKVKTRVQHYVVIYMTYQLEMIMYNKDASLRGDIYDTLRSQL